MIHRDLINNDYVEWKSFLKETDHWTIEDIQRYQLAHFKRILQRAYRTSFYAGLYARHGVHFMDIQSLGSIEKIPFVTKQDLRDNLRDMTVQDGRELEYTTTGGSTGTPTGLYRTKQAFARELASKAHQYERVGWKEGDRQVVFRGLVIDNPSKMSYEHEFEELRCSSYHLTPEYLDIFFKEIWKYRPDWLRFYPSTGVIVAKYLKDRGLRFPALRGILSSSENLLDWHKKLFLEVFGVRTFTHYGHYEMAALAGFCEHEDTYHVLPQYGYTELIGQDGKQVTVPGQTGEVVSTSFLMDATILIRYRTGDIATFKGWGCPKCHRPYQIWEKIDGRIQEYVVAKNNRYISLSSINFHDTIYDHLFEHQFYQDTIGHVTLKYIPKPSCNSRVLEQIYKEMKTKLGDVELVLEKVDNIDKSMRGKHNLIIQKLHINQGDLY
jgi:phenylacetate-CoA ligase